MPLEHPKILAETFLEQNPIACVVVNKAGEFIFANEAALKLIWNAPCGAIIDRQTSSQVWGSAQDFEGHSIPFEKLPISLALRGIKTVGKDCGS